MNQSFEASEEEKNVIIKKFTQRKSMKVLFPYCFRGSSPQNKLPITENSYSIARKERLGEDKQKPKTKQTH